MLISRHATKAFTLLELIVVIVILGILAALAIPTFSRVIKRTQDATTLATLASLGRDSQALRAFTVSPWTPAEDVSVAVAETPVVKGAGNFATAVNGRFKATQASSGSAEPSGSDVVFAINGELLVLSALSPSGNVCVQPLGFTASAPGYCGPAKAAGSGSTVSDAALSIPGTPGSPVTGSGATGSNGTGGTGTTAPAPCAGTYAACVIASGSSQYTRFDDASAVATAAADVGTAGSYGNRWNTAESASLVRGGAKSFSYGRSGSSFTLPGTSASAPAGASSVELWYDAQAGPGFMSRNGINPLTFTVQAASVLSVSVAAANVQVPNAASGHLVVTIEPVTKTTATLKVYHNGSLKATQSISYNTTEVGGTYSTGGNGGGTVDELAVYPKALSAADVLGHYQAGKI